MYVECEGHRCFLLATIEGLYVIHSAFTELTAPILHVRRSATPRSQSALIWVPCRSEQLFATLWAFIIWSIGVTSFPVFVSCGCQSENDLLAPEKSFVFYLKCY